MLLICLALILFIYAFHRLDCNIQLWFLDVFLSRKIYSKHVRGQVVWITGASSGIGEYIAYEYARAGCRLVLSATNRDRLHCVANKCLEINTKLTSADIMIIPFDISDYESHIGAIDLVLANFSRIDILINNAGKTVRASFERIAIAIDEDLFKINVFGPIHLTRLVVNHWLNINQKGQIGVTSSVSGITLAPFASSYSGSKYALHGYFESLRIERHRNVDVTLLCPGPVFSRIYEASYTDKPGVLYNKVLPSDAKLMSTQRCARLSFVALCHKVPEAWISIQPVLSVCYLTRYWPRLMTFIFKNFISEEKLMNIVEGK